MIEVLINFLSYAGPVALAFRGAYVSQHPGIWIAVGAITVTALMAKDFGHTRWQKSVSSGIERVERSLGRALEPEVRWGPKKETRDPSGAYLTEYDLEVVSPYPVSGIWFEVYGQNVRDLRVAAQRAGVHLDGNSGTREKFAFTTIQQARGRYKLSATSDKPIEKINYGFE